MYIGKENMKISLLKEDIIIQKNSQLQKSIIINEYSDVTGLKINTYPIIYPYIVMKIE